MKLILKGLLIVVVVATLGSGGLQAMLGEAAETKQYITAIQTEEPETDVTLVSYENPLGTPIFQGEFLRPQTDAKAAHVIINKPRTITLDKELEIPFETDDIVLVVTNIRGKEETLRLSSYDITQGKTSPSRKWLLIFKSGKVLFEPQNA